MEVKALKALGTDKARKQIIVIGGGAAGLMAAVIAGREGARVILLEKMNMVGKKWALPGKGPPLILRIVQI